MIDWDKSYWVSPATAYVEHVVEAECADDCDLCAIERKIGEEE